jgi:hypothetical protein
MSIVVNWSINWSIIDQFPRQAVVVNCPPFMGALTACPPPITQFQLQRTYADAVAWPADVGRGRQAAHEQTGKKEN